jgi:hypothetical protein
LPTGGSEFYESNIVVRLRCDFDINCIHSFFAALGIERDFVAFTDVVNQTRDMNKNFLVRGAVNNKAKSLGFVEELYGSTVHLKKIENCDVAKCRGKGRGINHKYLIFNIVNKIYFLKPENFASQVKSF